MAFKLTSKLHRFAYELATPKGVARSIVFIIGYILSPASWWNDAFVNIPLAYLFAWIITRIVPGLSFPWVFGGAYLATNVVGMIMMHFSVKPPNKKTIIIDIIISVAYTAAIIMFSSIILG